MKFSGKNVLITGASRGIGAAAAKLLASYGLKVWVNYLNNKKAAKEIVKEIKKNGGIAEKIQFDVSNESEFHNAISKILNEDGTLSYLVNNAGKTDDVISLKMSVESFKNIIDNNLVSTFIGCKEAANVMRMNQFGSIVNISSIVAETGNAGQASYSASKGGILSLTKTLAQELAPLRIRVNVITPGLVETDMSNKIPEGIKNKFKSQIPMKRFGDVNEIAYSIAFLLSDHSSYITGETLKVNGGLNMV